MKKLAIGYLAFCAVIMCGSQACATALSFSPTASSINSGENFNVEVVISSLQNSFVGGFNVAVSFDDTMLNFISYSLTENLGSITLADAEDWSFGYDGFNTVYLSEISYLSDLSFQGDSFTIANISFTGNNVGSSEIVFNFADISNDFGYEIPVSLGVASVDVTSGTPVPEPGTMILFGAGVGCLLVSQVRKKRVGRKGSNRGLI